MGLSWISAEPKTRSLAVGDIMDLDSDDVVTLHEIGEKSAANDEHIRAVGGGIAGLGRARARRTVRRCIVCDDRRRRRHAQPAHFGSVQVKDRSIIDII